MSAFAGALEVTFDRVRSVKLDRAYAGLQKFRFVEALERGGGTVAWYDVSSDTISVYPMAFSVGDRIDLAVYAGLGTRYWHKNISSSSKVEWARKLVHVDRAVMDRLADALDRRPTSYVSVLEGFHTATERLQVIHVLNALITNSIAPSRVQTIDIFEYPPTADFCSGKRPFSIKPLLSVYSNLEDISRYEYAFAQYCAHQGKFRVSEIGTHEALIALFERISLQ